MGIFSRSRVIKGERFDKSISVQEKRAFRYFKLYKSQYQELTKMPSPFLAIAISLSLITIGRIFEVLTYCFSGDRFHIEPRDRRFIYVAGGSAVVSFVFSKIARNPRKKMKKILDGFFKDIV